MCSGSVFGELYGLLNIVLFRRISEEIPETFFKLLGEKSEQKECICKQLVYIVFLIQTTHDLKYLLYCILFQNDYYLKITQLQAHITMGRLS